jgi:hypothetical protein
MRHHLTLTYLGPDMPVRISITFEADNGETSTLLDYTVRVCPTTPPCCTEPERVSRALAEATNALHRSLRYHTHGRYS